MKYFQVVWGYITLLSIDKFISIIIEFVFRIQSIVTFLILVLLSLILFQIHPLKESSCPFDFQIELRTLGFRLKA